MAGNVQILHEVGEFNLQQPNKLNEADQAKANEDAKREEQQKDNSERS